MRPTKLLLVSSAGFLALLGLFATFLPDEILRTAGMQDPGLIKLFIQLLGALYLAFAMMNWMSREAVIGGIYNRPLALGNFLHFAMGALALARGLSLFFQNGQGVPGTLLAVIYAVFAVAFAFVLFRSPVIKP